MAQNPLASQDPDYPPADTPSPSGVVPAHISTLADGAVHIDTRKPIPFDRHRFGAACYDTYGCRVLYNNRYEARDADDIKQISSASLGFVYPDNLPASTTGIRNFPLPAQVSWRDKEGHAHETSVDIAAIFKDQVVLHNVPQDQLPPILTAPIYPDIILEVNDRTIKVWMRAFVPTKELQTPGNIHSRFRDDMILAYSKIY